jgi:hypothetical protein
MMNDANTTQGQKPAGEPCPPGQNSPSNPPPGGCPDQQPPPKGQGGDPNPQGCKDCPDQPPKPADGDCKPKPDAPNAPAPKCNSGPPKQCIPQIKCEPDCCCCPPKPTSTPSCLDALIDQQLALITAADQAKTFKAELEDITKKAKAARQEYTRDRYATLTERWKKQDGWINDLIAKLTCAVRCWRCVIECELCPLLYDIRNLELKLNGDGTLACKVYSLKDLQNWQTRDRDIKKEAFNRIKTVLAAWEKPAQTLDKILADNLKLIEETKKIIATDSVAAIYDVFMRLLPMHLAITPEGAKSDIPAEFQEICPCDKSDPDKQCGPDVGRQTLRQRLIGPQPYIADPNSLFEIICCLARDKYLPAKDALATAEAELAKTENDIKRITADIDQKKTSIAADFKARVANPVNCDDYKCKPCPPPPPPPGGIPCQNTGGANQNSNQNTNTNPNQGNPAGCGPAQANPVQTQR